MSRPSTSRGLESDDDIDERSSSSGILPKIKKGKPSRCLGGGSVISAASNKSGSTVVSVKSLRRPEVIAELPVLSDEQKLRSMLGFKDEDINKVCAMCQHLALSSLMSIMYVYTGAHFDIE